MGIEPTIFGGSPVRHLPRSVEDCRGNKGPQVPLHQVVRPLMIYLDSRACQETGAITPAPVNTRKMIGGAWSITLVKKKKNLF
jgi:hypothetical protein